MKSNTILKILNPILLLLIINQTVTGALGPKLSYPTFVTLHEGGGTLLIFLVFAHLALNAGWLKTNYFAK